MSGVRKTSGSSEARGVAYHPGGVRLRAVPVERPGTADSTGITEAARELARADAVVEDAAEIRTERVLALKQQIARGDYRPDPREVARRLLERGF